MFHDSPHRTGPRLRALRSPAGCGRTAVTLATLALAALALSTGSGVRAASDPRLPGGIPKAPRYLTGYPIPFPRTVDYRPRQGSVVLGDIDSDGRPDLVVSVPSGQVLALRADGSRLPGWPRAFQDLAQPAFPLGEPAIGDLDGDGSPEVVTCVVSGTPMRRNFLYALRSDGSDLPGWPIEVRDYGTEYFSCAGNPTVLADLDGDGGPDVIHAMTRGSIVAFDRFGRALPGWPVRLGPDRDGHIREINADMAVADLDGDGRDDLVFVESALGPRLASVSGEGRLLPGFPKWLPEITDRQAPAVSDLDGDGRPELVQATMPFLGDLIEPVAEPGGVVPAIPAALHVLRPDGSDAPGWPRSLQVGAPWGALPVDLDGDGRLEILQQDGDEIAGFDAEGNVLSGYPVVVHRDFVRSGSVETTPWVAADLNGDGRTDLLQARSNQYAGLSCVRVFGLRVSGQPIRGFPFDADGMLAASRPRLADLSGDGVNDLVMLLADGGNGGWILAAWDLGALARTPR